MLDQVAHFELSNEISLDWCDVVRDGWAARRSLREEVFVGTSGDALATSKFERRGASGEQGGQGRTGGGGGGTGATASREGSAVGMREAVQSRWVKAHL